MSRVLADDLYYPLMDRQNKLGGVTIRAEFAKAAMQGILANSAVDELEAAQIASDSVLYADALIEALNKD